MGDFYIMSKHNNLMNFLATILFILLFSMSVFADDAVLYDQAHRLLNQKQYSEAHQIFSQLANFGSNIQMGAAYQFYTAKAGYYSGYLEESLNDFSHVINRFPQSSYVPYAYFFSGNIDCFLGHPGQAVVDYGNAFKTSNVARGCS